MRDQPVTARYSSFQIVTARYSLLQPVTDRYSPLQTVARRKNAQDDEEKLPLESIELNAYAASAKLLKWED